MEMFPNFHVSYLHAKIPTARVLKRLLEWNRHWRWINSSHRLYINRRMWKSCRVCSLLGHRTRPLTDSVLHGSRNSVTVCEKFEKWFFWVVLTKIIPILEKPSGTLPWGSHFHIYLYFLPFLSPHRPYTRPARRQARATLNLNAIILKIYLATLPIKIKVFQFLNE